MIAPLTVSVHKLSLCPPQVNKDGSGYPPNSIVIGMFEGYYSYPAVGGVSQVHKVVVLVTTRNGKPA